MAANIETLYKNARAGLAETCDILSKGGSKQSVSAYLDLVSRISTREADILLYLGSGVSKTVQLTSIVEGAATYAAPTWVELLERLFEKWSSENKDASDALMKEWHDRAGVNSEKHSILTLLQGVDKLQLAWMVGQLFTREERDKHIRDIVQPAGDIHSLLLRQLVRLPSSTVVTTNYDDNIKKILLKREIPEIDETTPYTEGPRPNEDYLKSHLRGVVEIVDRESLAKSFDQGGVHLYYLHGSVNSSSRIVLDRFDYAELMSEREGLFDYVSYKLRSIPAIYVGFGLDDPSFNLMENRLYSVDPSRPKSYAFVSVATEEEHRWWLQRNLRLIQYGRNHEDLVTLIRIIADTRKFLCWAEPSRLPDTSHDANRTQGYLFSSLLSYANGDYMTATKKARASLASTLFWGPVTSKIPTSRGFYERCQIIDARIRLGLSHHKQRYLAGRPEALQRAKINVEAADELLKALCPKDDKEKFTTRVYRASLDVLRARLEYSVGDFAISCEFYKNVKESLSKDVKDIFDHPRRHQTYEDLKGIECFSYASCQLERIAYQFVSEPPSETRRQDEAENLLKLRNKIEKVLSTLKFDDYHPLRATGDYFQKSLVTLSKIAQSFAGRLYLGGFGDVIPTRNERCSGHLKERVKKAIECLEQSPDEKYKGSISPRWQSLRQRYLARSYALQWFLKCTDEDNSSSKDLNIDLFRAFTTISDAFELVASLDLERDRILTHHEMARISIVAAYGIALKKERSTAEGILYQIITADHHLTKALNLISKDAPSWPAGQGPQRDIMFLAAMNLRYRAYVFRLCKSLNLDEELSSPFESTQFVKKNDQDKRDIFQAMGLNNNDYEIATTLLLTDTICLHGQVSETLLTQRARDLLHVFQDTVSELTQVVSVKR